MQWAHSTWQGMAVFCFAVEKKGLVDSMSIEQCPVQGQKSLHHHIHTGVNSASTL